MVHFCRYCDAIESKRWHRIVLSRQQLQARVCHGCLLLPQRGPRAHKKVCAIASQVLAFRAEPRATANERKATSTFGTKQTSALLSATSAFGVERTLQPKLPTRDQALRVAAIYFRKRTSSQKGRRNCAQDEAQRAGARRAQQTRALRNRGFSLAHSFFQRGCGVMIAKTRKHQRLIARRSRPSRDRKKDR